MTDIAIRVDNLSKLYPARSLRAGHLGALRQRHDTLRDALTGIFRRVRPSPPPSADELWALKDVSFDARHGEVVATLALASGCILL